MKSLIWGGIILLNPQVNAQSPGLTINVTMDSAKTGLTRYKIEMKICEPKKKTARGNWFRHDTSTINFASLKANQITCGEYFDKGMPTLISGKEEKSSFNQFQFSGQVFAWEKIFIFKISNWSSRGWHPEMYIVLPMKYKSFRTSVDLTAIEFQEGKVVFLTDQGTLYNESKLTVSQSLKNEKNVDVKDFSLKEIL